jgi:hypothetical protein
MKRRESMTGAAMAAAESALAASPLQLELARYPAKDTLLNVNRD